jgi:zinc transport system substrate-binding protein
MPTERRIRALAFAVGGALAATAAAGADRPPAVVATIQPIHSLVAGVTDGVTRPTLLLPGGASPHAYQLRPSDARALEAADVVFWVGEELETFLVKPLATLAGNARVIALAEAEGLTRRPGRAGGPWETDAGADHDHDHDHGHDHDDHDLDMHLWLDPANAKATTAAIVAALAEADPGHAERYEANGARLAQRLDALDGELRADLAPLAGRPYVVFHDAYQYLEARYGLTPVGAVTLTPDRQPSARRLRALRQRIIDSGAVCVFSEPQFEPSIVATIIEETPARSAVLDPLGADLSPGADAYILLMKRLATALTACLSPPP